MGGFHSLAWHCVCAAVAAVPGTAATDVSRAAAFARPASTACAALAWVAAGTRVAAHTRELLALATPAGTVLCGRAGACVAYTGPTDVALVVVPRNHFRGLTSTFSETEYAALWHAAWARAPGSGAGGLTRATHVVGTREQCDRMRAVAQEAVLGPRAEDCCAADWPPDAERLAATGTGACFAAERAHLLRGTPQDPALLPGGDPWRTVHAFAETRGAVALGPALAVEHHRGLVAVVVAGALAALFDSEFMALSGDPILSPMPLAATPPAASSQQQQQAPAAAAPVSVPAAALSIALKQSEAMQPPQQHPQSAAAGTTTTATAETTTGAGGKFVPPVFGVTVLGCSESQAAGLCRPAGFVLWVDGACVLVDPPPHSAALLAYYGVAATDVVLTHAHLDFHRGLHTLLLGRARVTLHTTATVMASCTRLVRAAVGRDYTDHCAVHLVQVGVPTRIAGATFVFDYALHTVPTLGFTARFRGRTVGYTGAGVYDACAAADLWRAGAVTAQRREALLLHGVLGADLALCAVGAGPAHTPPAALALLPAAVRARVLLLNCGDRALTPDACARRGLALARTGVAHTRAVPLDDYETGRTHTLALLRCFCSNALNRALPADALPPILAACVERTFPEGATIVGPRSAGTESDKNEPNNGNGVDGDDATLVYLLSRGTAAVVAVADDEPLCEVHPGDIVAPAGADEGGPDDGTRVVARTRVEAYACPRAVLEGVGRAGVDLLRAVRLRAFVRASLLRNRVFGTLAPAQVALLASCVSGVVHLARDEKLIRQGDTGDRALFIVHSGAVRVEVSGRGLPRPLECARLGPGAIVGEMAYLLRQPRSADVITCGPTTVLRLSDADLDATLTLCPCIRYLLTALVSSRVDDAPVSLRGPTPSPPGPGTPAAPATPASTTAPAPFVAPKNPTGFACPAVPVRRAQGSRKS